MTGVQTCALRSEEHTSELQSHDNLVCRLLLEKKKTRPRSTPARRAPPRPARLPTPRGRVPARRRGFVRRGLSGGAHVVLRLFSFFFFNDGAPPEFYSFPLPAPLPI